MKIHEFESANPEALFTKVQSEKIVDPSEKIEINVAKKHQEIDGFGASFTDSAAFLIDKVLNDSDKADVMTKLFDPKDGIGLSTVRNPMGASDYARFIYSYDDQLEGQFDPELKDFSIDHDRESILPLTKWALQLNPDLKLFASPWSAPGWMKNNGKMVTGKLLEEYYGTYAQYFARFIQAYAKEDLPIYAVTPQNEPLFEPPHYPGMELLAHEAVTFVKDYLKPTFESERIETKILGYDHNWDRVDYGFDILDHARDSFDGVAWHWYGGRPFSQTRVQQAYPDKEVHFTEGSGGEWIPEFEPAFSNLMRTGIAIMRNHSKSFILWNMALDENNGPTVPGFGNSTCRGLLKINQSTRKYEYTLDYYGLAHFSKYVRPGARRVWSSDHETIKNVVFQNKDQSLAIVLFNDSEADTTVRLQQVNQVAVDVTLAAKSAKTIVIEFD